MALTDKDIDDTMAADWASIQEKYAVEESEPDAPVKEVAEEAPEKVSRETSAEPERARDETGKFIPKEKADDEVARDKPRGPASPVADQRERAAAQPVVAQPLERDITRAPNTWKPTARADWEKLPEPVRAEIHRRETDFLNGQSQLLPDAKFGKAVADVVAPYRMLIESEGGTPERAIGDLLRTAAVFRVGTMQQKTQALGQIAQQYGIDVRGLFPQQGTETAQAHPPQGDPRVDQLIRELNLERQRTAQAEQANLEAVVQSWMNEPDDKGQPKRPYLGDVMQEVTALLPQIRQQSPSLPHNEVLQQAYERATWGNPEIRALLIKAQNAPLPGADNQNRVREARRAASVNVPRRGSLPSAGPPGTIDETIAATARELGLIT